MAPLTRDWSEFLSLLISHRVKTEGVDVFVAPGMATTERRRAALADCGFGSTVKGRR